MLLGLGFGGVVVEKYCFIIFSKRTFSKEPSVRIEFLFPPKSFRRVLFKPVLHTIRLINLKPDIMFLAGRFDGRKIRSKFLRSIFNPAHHFCRLCHDLLAGRTAFVRKRCGGKFGQSVLVDSLPKLIFGPLRYSSILTTNLLCRHEFETSK